MTTVHEQVAPHLDGRFTEEQLLSAVSAKERPILQKYFDGLRDAGAFAHQSGFIAPPLAVALSTIKIDDPIPGAAIQAVTFDRDPGMDVWFVSPRKPRDVLVRLDTLFQRARPLVAALLLPPPENVRDEMAPASMHSFLLHLAQSFVAMDGPVTAAFYLVDPVKGTSRSLFVQRRDEPDASVFSQLIQVGPSSLPQLPLVSVEATHDLLSIHKIRVGLNQSKVEQAALDALLAEIAFQRPGGWPEGLAAAASGAIDSNRTHAHLRALEQAVWARTRATTLTFTRCDLLEENPGDDAARYLADVLGKDHASISARYTKSIAGLHIYMLDDVPVYSTDARVAQRLALILAVARTTLAESVAPDMLIADGSSTPSSRSVEARIEALTAALAAPVCLIHTTTVWGHTLFAVTVEGIEIAPPGGDALPS